MLTVSSSSLLYKISPKVLLISAAVATSTTSTQAATVATSEYLVRTEIDTVEEYTASSGVISSEQTMEFNSNKGGPIRAAATAMLQEDNHAGEGTFRFFAGDIAPSNQRPSGWADSLSSLDGPFGGADANVGALTNLSKKSSVEAGSKTTFTVTFDLAVDEVKLVNFYLDYTIEVSGTQQTAEVSWDLTWDGDANWLGLSGSDTQNTPEYLKTTNTGLQNTVINQAGTYTLTMTSEVPVQTFNNQNKTASATLDAVYFEVVAVPEPSSTALLALALSGSLFFRRR